MLNKLLVITVMLMLIPAVISASASDTVQELPAGKCHINEMSPIALGRDTMVLVHTLSSLEMSAELLEMFEQGLIEFIAETYPIVTLSEDDICVEFVFEGEDFSLWTLRTFVECY